MRKRTTQTKKKIDLLLNDTNANAKSKGWEIQIPEKGNPEDLVK